MILAHPHHGHSVAATLVLMACLLSSCSINHQAHRKTSISFDPCDPTALETLSWEPASCESEPEDRNFRLVVVEFDDYGDLWNLQQRQIAVDKLRELEDRQLLFLTFVHGWKHDARHTDSNFRAFREIVHKVAEHEDLCAMLQGEFSDQSVPLPNISVNTGGPCGVYALYIGWRGDPLGMDPLHNLSVLNRRSAAQDVSDIPASALVSTLVAQVAQQDRARLAASVEDPASAELAPLHLEDVSKRLSRTILLGHSFGARFLENALAQTLVGRRETSERLDFESRISTQITLISELRASHSNYLDVKSSLANAIETLENTSQDLRTELGEIEVTITENENQQTVNVRSLQREIASDLADLRRARARAKEAGENINSYWRSRENSCRRNTAIFLEKDGAGTILHRGHNISAPISPLPKEDEYAWEDDIPQPDCASKVPTYSKPAAATTPGTRNWNLVADNLSLVEEQCFDSESKPSFQSVFQEAQQAIEAYENAREQTVMRATDNSHRTCPFSHIVDDIKVRHRVISAQQSSLDSLAEVMDGHLSQFRRIITNQMTSIERSSALLALDAFDSLRPPVDVTLMLNPATEGIRARQLHEALADFVARQQRIMGRGFSPSPYMVQVGTTSDTPVAKLLPMVTWVSNALIRRRPKPSDEPFEGFGTQRSLITHSLPQLGAALTHCVIARDESPSRVEDGAEYSVALIQASKESSCANGICHFVFSDSKEFRITRPDRRMTESVAQACSGFTIPEGEAMAFGSSAFEFRPTRPDPPIWAIASDRSFMDGHNDIFDWAAGGLTGLLLKNSSMLTYSCEEASAQEEAGTMCALFDALNRLRLEIQEYSQP